MQRRNVFRVLLCAVLFAHRAQAENAVLPLDLQVQLLQKVVRYDRNFRSRAAGRVRTLILIDSRESVSVRSGQTVSALMSELDELGGLPHEERILAYSDAAALRAAVDATHVSIVYLMPGLGDRVSEMAAAVNGADLLTVSAVPSHVREGVVLGFDLLSSQPKLLVNLTAAQRQNVAFPAQVLKVMKVYR